MKDQQETFGYSGDGTAQDVIRWALDTYHPDIALACSFQHPVLVHMMVGVRSDVRVFGIDTGRLHEETYRCAHELEERFGVKIEWYFPRHDAVEALTNEKGVFSFRDNLEARRECCAVRKVEPLNRALEGVRAWITGIRRDQNVTRQGTPKIERDHAHNGIVKINPIADWTAGDVWEYAQEHNLPYNRLLDQGYTSVGCACCTRPVQPDEDPRAGRWWWEHPEHKECGLHIRNWNI